MSQRLRLNPFSNWPRRILYIFELAQALVHRVLKGSGSTAATTRTVRDGPDRRRPDIFPWQAPASRPVIPMRLKSADTVEDLDILIWLLPLPLPRRLFRHSLWNFRLPVWRLCPFIKKLQVPDGLPGNGECPSGHINRLWHWVRAWCLSVHGQHFDAVPIFSFLGDGCWVLWFLILFICFL